jgi:hypothetical protein
MSVIIIGSAEAWGFIPGFLDESDPRPPREQFNERYVGGWMPGPPGLSFDFDTVTLTYPGDPPMTPISVMQFRTEWILLFPSSWVLILQPGGSWEVARMD